MNPTNKHIWERLLRPSVVIVVVGVLAIVAAAFWLRGGESAKQIMAGPSQGTPEGGQVIVDVPTGVALPSPITATFHDAGEHGFIAVKSGGGVYMTYDPTTNLDYKTDATSAGPGKVTVAIPDGICGYIVKSDLEPNPKPKVVKLTLTGPDGKAIPGAPAIDVPVKCDTYTLSVKTKASKDPVLPDGADQSTVTATLSVTGPAQYVNGQRVKSGEQKITQTTPLGLVFVDFTTDLGVLAPSPSKVKTDLAGEANVTITSMDAGIASVRATALAVGDAKQQVHFPPKITEVKMDFVEPNSPTNYQLHTLPANAAKLDFDWKMTFAGSPCGNLTGGASGKGLTKNAFFHGPHDGFPDGCPVPNEMASQVTVKVTDKDGQTDTKTFGARAFEAQGFVKLK